jgi:DNA-binding transcriptional LysR family regulator
VFVSSIATRAPSRSRLKAHSSPRKLQAHLWGDRQDRAGICAVTGKPEGQVQGEPASRRHADDAHTPGFMKEFPDIELDMDFTDHLVDVIDGGYDAVVRTGEAADSRLMSRRLGTYHLEVVGSPLYFAKAGIPKTPADLVTHACLHHRYPTSGKLERWPFPKSGPYADLALPVAAAVSSIEPLVSLAERGIGIACVPDFAVRRQIVEGTLIRILDSHIEHSGIFRAVWPSSHHLSPKLRAFVDYMAEHLFPKMPLVAAIVNGARFKLPAPSVRA